MKLSHCLTPATPWPRRGYSSLLRTSKHWGKLSLVKSCTWSIIILKVRTKYSPLWICKLHSHNYLPSSAIRVYSMHLVFNLLKMDFSQRGFPAVHLLHLHICTTIFQWQPTLDKTTQFQKGQVQVIAASGYCWYYSHLHLRYLFGSSSPKQGLPTWCRRRTVLVRVGQYFVSRQNMQ